MHSSESPDSSKSTRLTPTDHGIPTRPELGLAFICAVLAVAVNFRPVLTSVGPVTDLIRAETGLSTTTLGLLASIPVVCMGFGSLLTPRLNRRFGMDSTVTLALITLGIMTLIRSFTPAAGLWIGTVGIGLCIGVLNAALPAIIKRDFPTRASSVTGLYSATLTLSAGIASGLAVPIAGFSSWRWALGVWCVLVLTGLAAWAWSIRARRQLEPSLSAVVAAIVNSEGGKVTPTSAHDMAPLPHPATASEHHSQVWRTPLAWVITFFMGLQSFMFYAFVQWLPELEQSHGISATTAGWHMTIFQISGLTATLLVTAIQREHADQRIATALTGTLWLSSTLGLLLAPDLALLWVILMGAASGASFYLALSFISTRTRGARQASELSGMTQSIGYMIASIGPTISGALSTNYGWNSVLMMALGVSLALMVLGFIAGAPKKI